MNVCSFANPTRAGILFFVGSRRATVQETRSAAAFVRPLSSPTRTALAERRQRTHSTRGDWTLEPENQQPEPRRSSPEVEQHQLPADPNEPVRIESGSTDAAQTADSEGVSVPVPQPSPGEVPPASRAEGKAGDESQRLEEWEERLATLEADLTAHQIELAAHQEEVEAERKRLAEWNNEIQEREAFLRAGRKQFQATLDEFHAEQRRFRMAVVAVKAQRIRAAAAKRKASSPRKTSSSPRSSVHKAS